MSTILERLKGQASATFQRFIRVESASGLVLMAATAAALIIANSPLHHDLHALWERRLAIDIGGVGLDLSIHHWINDGLMAIFFLLVGVEIKRELLHGELGTVRKAALPAIAALGGMVAPALIYYALTSGSPYTRGWGIPTATDIAFAVGVMALLGTRAPLWLKVFVTALAIVDDIGAVVVIAVFYSSNLDWTAIAWAGGFTALLVVFNASGVTRLSAYIIVGAALWVAVLESGVHATIAGVILGMTIPTRPRMRADEFVGAATKALDDYRAGLATCTTEEEHDAAKESREAALVALDDARDGIVSPLHHLEHSLHGWVAYGILPLFAFANAGVVIPWSELGEAVRHPVTAGVAAGLVLGKPIGVFGATWLAIKLGVAELPAGARLGQLLGGACLAGIGFTMSMFIAGLAFSGAAELDAAKIGILGGSIVAAGLGAGILMIGRKAATATATASPPSGPGGAR